MWQKLNYYTDAGADLNIKNNKGDTPFDVAAQFDEKSPRGSANISAVY